MGCELHRELPPVLASEACRVKSKSKGALHKSLKKFWASSIKSFLKHLQAEKKKEASCTFQIRKKIAAYLIDTKITQTPACYNYLASTVWAVYSGCKGGSGDREFLCDR